MKKSILALLLVVCLIVCFGAFTASAEETSSEHVHCVCGGAHTGAAEHTCEELTWQPLPEGTVNFGSLDSGNYYLTADYTRSGSIYIVPGAKVNLCLNGHKLTTGGRSIAVNGELNICDCDGNGGKYRG